MDDLEQLRQELAAIDKELLDQFQRRMQIIDRVAAHKGQTRGAVYVPEQEIRILERIQEDVPENLASYARIFQDTLMRLSRERQYEVLLASGVASGGGSQGDTASVEKLVISGHLGDELLRAAKALYPDAQLMEAGDVDSACLEVARGLVDLAILPHGEESLLSIEKHALFIQACFSVGINSRRYAVVGDKLLFPSNPGTIGLLIRHHSGGAATAPGLLLVLTILHDLGLPVVSLQSLYTGALHLEFVADPVDGRATRALHQIEQEAPGVYLLGWYDSSLCSISSVSSKG